MSIIKIIFSGDFAPLVPLREICNNPFEELTGIFETADLHITNLEIPLTNNKLTIEKTGPSIKSDPDNIVLLQKAKVDVACLANNHIFDYGEKGLLDTIELCKVNKIDTLGVVNRPDGICHYIIKELKGKKIGFLNYCEHEFSVRDPGIIGAKGYDPIDAYYDIQKLNTLVDYLIVIYHGGNEYYPLPNPEMKKDFHYLADLGADAVIGHHTHVYSGYEIYDGKPLVYSLGNFFFPYENEPKEWYTGIICEFTFEEKIYIKIHPLIQCLNNTNVNLPDKITSENIMNRITELSNIIGDDRRLEVKWKLFVLEKGKGIVKLLLAPGLLEKSLLKLKIIQLDKFNHRARLIKNLIRCKSLRLLLYKSL